MRLSSRNNCRAALHSHKNLHQREEAAQRCPTDRTVRRCRPLLGTFVEISASAIDENKLNDAVNAAFDAIEKIQTLMGAHDPASELSLLNRAAALRPITISRETFTVLKCADKLASESNGAFDYTVAPTLADWGFLPKTLARKKSGSWRDVLLLRGRKVYFLQPLALDLGGIAKGFAVDSAIKILQRNGIQNAIVNAGGDLRAIGPQPSIVYLRHPIRPQFLVHKVQIRDSALATSSPCFTEKNWHGQRVSHLVNSMGRSAITGAISVSVRAKECWLADALTKIVLNAPTELAKKVLAKYQAEAFMLTA
jgi:thiamine biosynthesis lipoprotein